MPICVARRQRQTPAAPGWAPRPAAASPCCLCGCSALDSLCPGRTSKQIRHVVRRVPGGNARLPTDPPFHLMSAVGALPAPLSSLNTKPTMPSLPDQCCSQRAPRRMYEVQARVNTASLRRHDTRIDSPAANSPSPAPRRQTLTTSHISWGNQVQQRRPWRGLGWGEEVGARPLSFEGPPIPPSTMQPAAPRPQLNCAKRH